MPEQKIKIRNDITVSVDHELFVAICYQKSKYHSFVLVGVRDNQTHQANVLSAAGKYLDLSNHHVSCGLFRALISSVPSKLNEENFIYRNETSDISYKAFTITEEQYENYLLQIYNCKRSPYLGVYHKSEITANNEVIYQYNEFNNPEVVKSPLNQSVEKLSIRNTCRDTAKKMLNTTVEQSSQGSDIPSFFLSALPYETKIKNGKIQNNLFIFPIPPHINSMSAELFKILSTLYRQLEKIPKHYLNDPNTFKKFQEIKDLYVKLDTRKASNNIIDLFKVIDEWEIKNKQLIDAKRGFSLFRTTATRDMINEINQLRRLKP